MLNVPTDSEGMEIRPIETMGGEIVNDVFFTDCHVAGRPARRAGGPAAGCSSWPGSTSSG